MRTVIYQLLGGSAKNEGGTNKDRYAKDLGQRQAMYDCGAGQAVLSGALTPKY